MSGTHGDTFESRMHAYLDGELTPAEAEAFEQLMRSDPDLLKRVSTLGDVQQWVRTTRPVAPTSVAASVLQRIESGSPTVEPEMQGARAADLAAHASLSRLPARIWNQFVDQLRSEWTWGMAGAVGVAVAVVAISVTVGVRDPERSASRLQENANVVEQPAGLVGAPDDAELVRHHFVFEDEQAHEICLVGSFNKWHVCSIPMARTRDGRWQVAVDLPAGKHEYMFVVDDTWVTDPLAALHADDGFGNHNAVLILSASES